jgi:hypothetical protein
MTLQVGGVSKMESIKYAHESVGLRTEKRCAGDVQQKNPENYRPDFSSERAPHVTKSVTV